MSLKKVSILSRKHTPRKKLYFISIALISLITFSSILFCFFNISHLNSSEKNFQNENNFNDFTNISPKTQGGAPASILQDPYTLNFSKIWGFFDGNYDSNLSLVIDTYYREGNSTGDISDYSVYSLDNLLLYDTAKKYVEDLNSTQIYEAYLDLKSTDLWYEGENQNEYGFIKSINTGTGSKNLKRNLIDNIIPIMLLVNNMPISPAIGYINEIHQMLKLINSSQFWNNSYNIFLDYNSSDGNIYAESNLYAILATLKVAQNNNFNQSVQDMALNLANKTMITLTEYFWDSVNYGYYNSSTKNLTINSDDKILKTNALGILALIEFWQLTEDLEYLTNATLIFDKILDAYSTSSPNEYYTWYDKDWLSSSSSVRSLKGDTFLMKAYIKLFMNSGNLSYYNNATAIYEIFQNDFYDSNVDAYNKLDDGTIDENKNLLYNLRLIDAYLDAFDVYKKTSIYSQFNKTGTSEEFIFNQEDLVLNANYTFESNGYKSNIPNASITYQLLYPNQTWFYEETHKTNENGTDIFSFAINESLPIGEDYLVYIWANTTYFGFATTSLTFTVSSGISYISGLEEIEYLYQGERRNMTLQFNNSRDEHINLSFSLETDNDISLNSPRNIFLNSSKTNNIWINFSIINSAELGTTNFHFLIKNGSVIFLNYSIGIEIRNSLFLSEVAYDEEVVAGDLLFISLNLENFLVNESQSFNLSFTGQYIDNLKESYNLSKGEAITIIKWLNLSTIINVNSIEVHMIISKSDKVFYNQSFSIQVVSKLEVIKESFPSSVAQWSSAKFVLILRNNKRTPESFLLYINGKLTQTNLNQLTPGENRIEASVMPALNPYDFSVKSYHIVLKDSDGIEELSFYYEVQVLLSVMNLFLFYVLPIVSVLVIVLYFKNKEIKTNLLRR